VISDQRLSHASARPTHCPSPEDGEPTKLADRSFYDLLRRTRAPAYVAFDVIWLNGADLRPLPLAERRRHLQNILAKGSAIISEPLSVTGRGHELFELTCAHDLEGVVAKRLKDGYGSRARWLKIKNSGYSQNGGRRELFDSWRA